DLDLLDQHLIKSLMLDFSIEYQQHQPFTSANSLKEFLKNNVLSISRIKEVNNTEDLIAYILTGSSALVIEGLSGVLLLGTVKVNKRNIEEPITEALVRGPRIGFTEILTDNTALLRQHGKNEDLSLIKLQVGKRA